MTILRHSAIAAVQLKAQELSAKVAEDLSEHGCFDVGKCWTPF